MSLNTNTWNRIRYTIYQPFYDLIGRWFAVQRRRSIELLNLKPASKVLLVGAGTGLDLEFLPRDLEIVATDITPAMVQTLAARAEKLGLHIQALVMDGQALEYEAESFEGVILHLVLAIIPDPIRCIKEVERVLRKGGRAVIFDKFLPDNQRPSPLRRALNVFTDFAFTNINRQLGPILQTTSLRIIQEETAGFGGLFKIVLVEKPV
jgi:ubiquinone/menaquinone biosynthesis C-methylase UbiE